MWNPDRIARLGQRFLSNHHIGSTIDETRRAQEHLTVSSPNCHTGMLIFLKFNLQTTRILASERIVQQLNRHEWSFPLSGITLDQGREKRVTTGSALQHVGVVHPALQPEAKLICGNGTTVETAACADEDSSLPHGGDIVSGASVKRKSRDAFKNQLLERESVEMARNKDCGCGKSCHEKLSPGEIFDVRLQMSKLNQTEERDWREKQMRRRHPETGHFPICKVFVCYSAWAMFIGGPNYVRTFFHSLKRQRVEEIDELSPAAKRLLSSELPQKSTKQDTCHFWIDQYIKSVAEHDPVSGCVRCVGVTVKEIFGEFLGEVGTTLASPISFGTFRNAFKKVLEETKCSIVSHHTLTKCTTCVELATKIVVATQTTKARLREQLQLHRVFIRTLREMYYTRRFRPFESATRYASVIIDGMDQAKCHVPYSYAEHSSKSDLESTRVVQRIMGALLHGVGKFLYVINPNVKKGANQMITILQDVLSRVPQTVEVLSVQVDGASENWNKYALCFFFELVWRKRFKVIEMHRLPVGHTHEDIDQMFSVISRALKNTGAIGDPDEFVDFLKQKVWTTASAGNIHVARVMNVLDVESRYDGLVTANIRGLGHPNPVHVFKFSWSDVDNKPVIQYKDHENTPVWQPSHRLDDDETQWIPDVSVNGYTNLLSALPRNGHDSAPPLIQPEEWDTAKLKRTCMTGWNQSTLECWKRFWTAAEVTALTTPSLTWHRELFTRMVGADAPQQNEVNGAQPLAPAAALAAPPAPQEQVVIGTQAGVRLWTAARAAERRSKEVCPPVGSIVVWKPDSDSRAADVAVGYILPLSIGKVIAIDEDTADVELAWMFATSFDGVFTPWINEVNGEQNSMWLDVKQLVIGEDGHPLTLSFTRRSGKLQKSSIEALTALLGAEEMALHVNRI